MFDYWKVQMNRQLLSLNIGIPAKGPPNPREPLKKWPVKKYPLNNGTVHNPQQLNQVSHYV